MHISPSGKRYIGITSKTVEERWKNGLGYQTQIFYRAIQKYGWDNIQHIVVAEDLSLEQAAKMETELIKKYNTRSPNGYNKTDGGVGSHGLEISDLERKRTSERLKGKKLSEEHRRKIIRALNNRSPQIYRRVGLKNQDHNTKSVDRYSIDGTYIDSYKSIHEVDRKLGFDYRNISACCNGIQHSAYGYRWCFSGNKLSKYIHGLSKSVDQFDMDGNFIRSYDSITLAEKELGQKGSHSHITDCCNGKRKSCAGYIWKHHGGEQ